nr:helix-turn-helix domain-containing protein [Flavobacterium sp. ASV13]
MESKYGAKAKEGISAQAVSQCVELLSGKWKMQIVVFLLRHGSTRFMDLQRGIEGISPKLLSKDLQELHVNDIVSRSEPKLTGIAVEYELTPHGKTLNSLLAAIESWGIQHFAHLGNNKH